MAEKIFEIDMHRYTLVTHHSLHTLYCSETNLDCLRNSQKHADSDVK